MKYIDPDGREDDYTIKYFKTDFTIQYFENSRNGSISIEFGGNKYSLGKDLDIGSTIPFNAKITVPKDARLDIDNGTISLGITNVRNLDIGFSIQLYNKVVMSEQFKTELRNDKIAGVGMTIAGLAIMYGGAYLASVAPETAIGGQAFAGYTGFQMGGTLFCLGLGRAVGANKNSIAQDIISAGSPPDLDAYTTIGNFRKP